MKIEYWGDYICPFCYIGKTRLDKAVKELGLENRVEILMRSFELDCDTPITVRFSAAQHFAYKYGMPLKMAIEKVEEISLAGRNEGITQMDYAFTRSTNTLDAHRLTKYAAAQGNNLIQEMLYHAFFCEYQNIGEREVLMSVAAKAGLDQQEVSNVLESRIYEDEVRTDEQQAEQLGIHMIPHFIIDGKEQISGSSSLEEMKKALQVCMEEKKND